MTNMSYCRFHNTLLDLRDCADAMENPRDKASTDEAIARRRLIELCVDIAARFEDAEEADLDGVNEDDDDDDGGHAAELRRSNG
jgi:hypothetical protein